MTIYFLQKCMHMHTQYSLFKGSTNVFIYAGNNNARSSSNSDEVTTTPPAVDMVDEKEENVSSEPANIRIVALTSRLLHYIHDLGWAIEVEAPKLQRLSSIILRLDNQGNDATPLDVNDEDVNAVIGEINQRCLMNKESCKVRDSRIMEVIRAKQTLFNVISLFSSMFPDIRNFSNGKRWYVLQLISPLYLSITIYHLSISLSLPPPPTNTSIYTTTTATAFNTYPIPLAQKILINFF